MMADAWTIWLAFNGGLLLVLLLRRAWHRSGAPASAYGLWLLPPMLAVGASLPRTDVLPALVVPLTTQASIPIGVVQVSPGWSIGWVLCLVAQAGSLLLLLILLIRQLRFEQSLRGSHAERHPAWPEATVIYGQTGPALSGFWRPRLLLPDDFATRFSPRQQALAIAHERAHWQSGDVPLRALAWLLLILQWWNPLAWWALRCFINDQELANDARVLRHHPGAQRDYAQTLALAQGSAQAPLVCAMQPTHPLIWRVAMLKIHARARTVHGRMRLVTALTLSSLTGLVMALDTGAPPEPENPYTVLVDARFAGAEPASFAVAGPMGQAMEARIGDGDEAVVMALTVTRTADPAVVLLSTQVTRSEQSLAAPTLLLSLGEAGAVAGTAEAGESAGPWAMKLTVQKGLPGDELKPVEQEPVPDRASAAFPVRQPWQDGLAWTRPQDPDC